MKKDSITLTMESEKLRAVRRYMEKKDRSLEQELTEALHKLYERYVPTAVRFYIDEAQEEVQKPPRREENKLQEDKTHG